MYALTLRRLSLFFKILPISNTGVSISYILGTVHFLYTKLLLPTCLPRLESPQALCRKCSALPFLTGSGANKMTPLHVGTSYTHDFGFYNDSVPTMQSAWAGSQNHKLREWRGPLFRKVAPIIRGNTVRNYINK